MFSLRWHNFLKKKHSKWPTQKKTHFPALPILWIGPWVNIIDWCKGHWCGSSFMVMSLSDISIFCVFRLFLGLCQTKPLQYSLHQSILPTQGLIHEIFMKKYWELAELEKEFFWVGHFDSFLFKFFFSSSQCKISSSFIWSIIFFCTMNGFFRILQKRLSNLICTRL